MLFLAFPENSITGNFIEDCLFDSHPILTEIVTEEVTLEDGTVDTFHKLEMVLDAEGNAQLDPQYIEEAPPQGLYLPRYLNGVWIEGGVAPEPMPADPTVDERLDSLEDVMLFLI